MLTTLLSMAAAASPSPARALIWGGGTTSDAAASELKAFEPLADEVKELLVLAPGFPKVMQSESVQGLKPGFHIVLLGLCSESAAPVPIRVLKGIRESTYARAVTVDELACPTLAPGWKVTEHGNVATPSGTLGALTVKKEWSWRFFVTLTDAKGELLGLDTHKDSGL